MNVSKMFNYMNRLPIELDRLLEEINKLNSGKLNYSIQELQSLDLSSDKSENFRILTETNEYLGLCNAYFSENRPGNSRARNAYGEYLDKKNLSDDVDIDISDLKNKVFTLADLSFKANKLTKVICENTIDVLEGKRINSDGADVKNPELKYVIEELQDIYINSNEEKYRRNSVEDQLSGLVEKLKVKKNNAWRKNFDPSLSDEKAIDLLFNDLCCIWNIRDVLYEVKTQLNTELIRCLIEDNYTEFKNWGFAKDENGKLVFNFDSKQVAERYGYHIPEKMQDRVLSEQLIKEYENGNVPYILDFTSIIRKNNLDRIVNNLGYDGREFLSQYRPRAVDLLTSIDLENYNQANYEKINELYLLGKFMSEGLYNRIQKDHPELEKNCKILKEWVNPSKDSKFDLSELKKQAYHTKYEEYLKGKIEEILMGTGDSNGRIYIQSGNNLDIQASIYALKKHMKDNFQKNIDVYKIDAGEQIEGRGLYLDAGRLEGIEGYVKNVKNYEKIPVVRVINANILRAQKSTCGVLKQYGIYVPDKIVQYADGVHVEKILLARHGVNVCRYLSNKKLFDFAEERRADGTYLFDTELTDEELKKYSTIPKKGKGQAVDLIAECDKREKMIRRDVKYIANNTYTIHTKEGDKYLAIADHHVNNGAMISYSLGCDYYLSVADNPAEFDKTQNYYIPGRATFAVNANPRKGDGTLPEQLIEWCKQLRDDGKNDKFKMYTVARDWSSGITRKEGTEEKPFVKKTKDQVVFGGRKTPHLFVTFNDNKKSGDNLKDEIIAALLDEIRGKNKIEKTNPMFLMNTSVGNMNLANAKDLMYSIINSFETELTMEEQQVKVIEAIAKEKGEVDHGSIIQK